jgi:hypothetical protein
MPSETPRDRERPLLEGQRDFQAFDRVLDIIHDVFVAMHGGTFVSEERWRWDTPVITFTWGNGQQVNRNLNGLVLGGVRPTGIEVESNAWRDVFEGRHLVRRWRHFSAGRIDSVPITQETVAVLVEKAYSKVSSWLADDLEDREVLAAGE